MNKQNVCTEIVRFINQCTFNNKMRARRTQHQNIVPSNGMQSDPGLEEISAKLNAIVDRANAIENHLITLETLKDQKCKGPPPPPQYDSYRSFCNCDSVMSRCNRCPKSNGAKHENLGFILDVINGLRDEVSVLATRQNQMKSELDKIRGRLC